MKIKTTEAKVIKGLEEIEEAGGIVDWKKQKVKARGIVAEYGFNRDTEVLTVNIIDKPFFATESMIEEKLTEYFN